MPNRYVMALALLSLFSIVLPGSASEQNDQDLRVHVALDGKDSNPGTEAQPLATIDAAVAKLRMSATDRTKTSATIILHDGIYFLEKPITISAADSGSEKYPLMIKAATDAHPILSGGQQINNWQPTMVNGKTLWVADLPEVRSGQWNFHQLFVNGQRRPRAASPNQGFHRIAGLPDVTKKTPYNEGQNRFVYNEGDIQEWKNLKDVDVMVYHLWVGVRLRVDKIDTDNKLIYFHKKSRRRLTDRNELARYRVENAFELLDMPGEWYLDRSAGKLYYMPLPKETPSKCQIIAPRLTQLMKFVGAPEKKKYVEHVHVNGLSFQHSEWWPARNDTADGQAASHVPGAVQLDGAKNCRIENCAVSHVSNYGIQAGRGCQHNTIIGCHLYDLGAGGIMIGEMAQRSESHLQAHHNTVSDCHIHATGWVFPQAVGVWIGQSYDNLVAHNHIHDLYYTGISCGWTWGYGKTLARNNIIEWNHVHDIGKSLLSDMGGIYTLGMQPGTIIRHNVFHDISGYGYGGWGIYFDEGSTNILAENNLVYRTTHGGFHQHYGKENVVRNNIFAMGKTAQVRRTRVEPHLSFRFERNIVFWDTGKLLDGNWSKLQVEFDRNVYWQADKEAFRFANWTWEEWQKLGMDRNGKIVNPKFASPSQNNYQLPADSPALATGFEPFSIREVGIRKKYRK